MKKTRTTEKRTLIRLRIDSAYHGRYWTAVHCPADRDPQEFVDWLIDDLRSYGTPVTDYIIGEEA